MSGHDPLAVLLVDDAAIVRQPLRKMLERDPRIRVVGEAGTGDEAWRLFRSLRPEVVLLDIGLPDMSGLTLLTRFKLERPACVVIMLTSQADAEVREAALGLGADHFFDKTREFEQAINLVRSFATRPRPGDATKPHSAPPEKGPTF